MKYYELTPEELPEALDFRNSIFSEVDLARWHAMACTGVVARAEAGELVDEGLAGRIAGFIPLQFRSQVLRPGVEVPVVYENAVGVHERLRSRGIGGSMIDTAADFIADRADALFVIRGGEDTIGYRFYRKSGHSDLCYATPFLREPDSSGGVTERSRRTSGSPGGTVRVEPVDREDWIAAEERLIALHATRYGAYGGGRARRPGYWSSIFDGHVFGLRPWELMLARAPGGEIRGYAVIVRGTWKDHDDLHFYELVADDEATAAAIVERVQRDAPGARLQVPSVSLANPIRPLLSELGFVDRRSEPQIMARIVAPARLFSRLLAATPETAELLDGIRVICSTPHRTEILHEPKPGAPAPREVFCEMKEHDLARLLCCRLDLRRAIELEMVRCRHGDDETIEAIAEVCRPARWVQWYSDYV